MELPLPLCAGGAGGGRRCAFAPRGAAASGHLRPCRRHLLRWASFYLGNRLEKTGDMLWLTYALPVATGLVAAWMLRRDGASRWRGRLPLARLGEMMSRLVRSGRPRGGSHDLRHPVRLFLPPLCHQRLWFLLGVISIIFLVDFSETDEPDRRHSRHGMTAAALVTLYHVPLILQQTIPFITLFVGITTLVALNRRYEARRHARGRHLGLAVHAALCRRVAS